jgi:hypothetical protein
VDTREHAGRTATRPALVSLRRERGTNRHTAQALTGGGPEGNEQLTAITGVVLIILLAVIGVTILRIGQLISVHLFVGLLLIGPVLMKMASTGYRFVRYYTNDPAYRRKGPPEIGLRLIAPMVVLTTVVVFISGVLLMFNGPSGRGTLLLVHKASFIVWVVVMALHVLGHLPGLPASLRATRASGSGEDTGLSVPASSSGASGRWIALAGPLVGGVVLAIALIPDFAPWTAHAAFLHH